MRDGVITAVGEDVPIPAGARVHNMTGKTLYPGLIDSGSTTAAQSSSAEGAGYWNDQIRARVAGRREFQARHQSQRSLAIARRDRSARGAHAAGSSTAPVCWRPRAIAGRGSALCGKGRPCICG